VDTGDKPDRGEDGKRADEPPQKQSAGAQWVFFLCMLIIHNVVALVKEGQRYIL
jgi:hypothetical protein